MPKRSHRVFIGTSGWNYKHWKGVFYPNGLPAAKWFGHYIKHFDTVEINNTFYNLPATAVFKKWRQQAPAGFIYAVKANRFITHMKKLKDPEKPLKRFFSGTRYLEGNLGPVLYQLPPRWKLDPERLEAFLKNLPAGRTHVFEFRDDSWHADKVFTLLEGYDASFCVHDMPCVKCPEIATGKVAYLRFHGATSRYAGGYSTKALRKWAKWAASQAKKRDVYIYFNNDAEGHAVKDAKRLIKMVADTCF